MQARDIMTTKVVTVGPEDRVEEVAKILLAKNIAAVPVIDESGRAIGIVSETDFLRRPETGTLGRRSWLAYFEAPSSLAEEFSRLHGTRARDVMSKRVHSIAPKADLLDVVDLMEKEAIRRVLVTEEGKLRGIICRSDLLRAMLAQRESMKVSEADRAIRTTLLQRLRDQPWRSITEDNVTVINGTVCFWGTISSEVERRALRIAAENIPGVTGVEDRTIDHPAVPVPLL